MREQYPFFRDGDEQTQAVIGEEAVSADLDGDYQKPYAVLTQKRLYCKNEQGNFITDASALQSASKGLLPGQNWFLGAVTACVGLTLVLLCLWYWGLGGRGRTENISYDAQQYIDNYAATLFEKLQKLNADEYIDLRTGVVELFQHTTSRAEDKASVAQSLRNLRDIINSNLTEPESALWVTLTYKSNMRDPQRLYEDFHAFIKRFRRYLKREGHPPTEYIAAAEPQGRGAWHLHVLLLFPEEAPFIPNSHMAKLWGHGFTKTKSLKGVDNPGLYLTAYLGDMELTEAVMSGTTRGRLGEVEAEDEQGRRQKKAVIKGARLHLYPSGFNLYRCSRGVKRPQVLYMTEGEAQEIIKGAPLTYEKTIAVTDSEGQTLNVINYRQYNRARVED